MRFREWFMIVWAIVFATLLGWFGTAWVQGTFFASTEISRDDARRQKAALISKETWVEYQVATGSNTLRLYTNAVLGKSETPSYGLNNPRQGWKYAIEYELLDESRNLIRKNEYHFRSTIREVVDSETNQVIQPLFIGETSLPATQTRTMHVPIHDLDTVVSIVRVRLASADPQIDEVVTRAVARIERQDFDQLKTWNRMSKQRHEMLSKYCVYSHDLLTKSERDSLMRWRWAKCPVIGECQHRYLFFVGDLDDQDAREDQVPVGLYMDPRSLATMPIPEGQATVRLEFQSLDQDSQSGIVSITNHPIEGGQKTFYVQNLGGNKTEPQSLEIPVNGGILDFKPSTRAVVRAFWNPIDSRAKQIAESWDESDHYTLRLEEDELEVTPRPMVVRNYLASENQPVDFAISHLDDEPTPLRLQVRYPRGTFFNGSPVEQYDSNESMSSVERAMSIKPTQIVWEYLDNDGRLVDSGILDVSTEVSSYDRLVVNGQDQQTSDATEYFFRVPTNVSNVRIKSPTTKCLVNGYVRPAGFARTVRVPEDYHAFHRIQSVNRAWFGLKPVADLEMIRSNRSFVVAVQSRPRDANENILNGNYQWIGYTPEGNWIARQMLVPHKIDGSLKPRPSALASTYFEIASDQEYRCQKNPVAFGSLEVTPKLVFAGDQAPGEVEVLIDGVVAKRLRLLTERGELDLKKMGFETQGNIEVRSENQVRFFVKGLAVQDSEAFLKRTAQRLDHGQLHFKFSKLTTREELLTLKLYRHGHQDSRCKISVTVELPVNSNNDLAKPQSGFTITKRVYDLRPMDETDAVLLGQNSCVDTGYRCFIRLGEELPPGDYQIKVDRLDGGEDGLVLLYQTIVEDEPVSIATTIGLEQRGRTVGVVNP